MISYVFEASPNINAISGTCSIIEIEQVLQCP